MEKVFNEAIDSILSGCSIPPEDSHKQYIVEPLTILMSLLNHCKERVSILYIDPGDEYPLYHHILFLRMILEKTEGDMTILHRAQRNIDILEKQRIACNLLPINNVRINKHCTWRPEKDRYDIIFTERLLNIPGVVNEMLRPGGRILWKKNDTWMIRDKDIRSQIQSFDLPKTYKYGRKIYRHRHGSLVPQDMIDVLNQLNERKIQKAEEVEDKKEDDTQHCPLVERLAQTLECPVCLEMLLPPTSCCVNGHSICKNCMSALYSCPLCRVTTFVRNLMLDNVLREMPRTCRGKGYGCLTVCTHQTIEEHELVCPFLQSYVDDDENLHNKL